MRHSPTHGGLRKIKKKNKNMKKELRSKIKLFKNHLLISRGLERITINGYAGAIKRTLRKIGSLEPSKKQLNRFVTDLFNGNYSYSHTVNTCLAIERYMEFLGRPVKFGRPRKPKSIIKDTLTEAEIILMMIFTRNIREKAILALLAYSGVRNRELCNVKVRDLDLSNNFIRVLAGKGKKDGVVCIAPACAKILQQYLTEHSRFPEDRLFTTLHRNHAYAPGDLRKLVKVIAKRAQIQKRVYPHIFRHSLATNMLNRGADIFLIKEQLRHSFVDTTLIYLRSTQIRTQTQYQFYVPCYA